VSNENNKTLVLKAGVLYFALVFAAGFVLGIIRTLWLVPRFGARTAETRGSAHHAPVTITSALWVVRRLAVPSTRFNRLGMGGVALALLLVTEFTLVLWLRGQSIIDYVASRDPVTGTVYYLLLAVFAITPFLVARRSGSRKNKMS